MNFFELALMDDCTIIVAFGSLFMVTLYFTIKSSFQYKISGLVVNLQYGLLLGEFLFVLTGSLRLAAVLQ
jgi:hypothetical protein